MAWILPCHAVTQKADTPSPVLPRPPSTADPATEYAGHILGPSIEDAVAYYATPGRDFTRPASLRPLPQTLP